MRFVPVFLVALTTLAEAAPPTFVYSIAGGGSLGKYKVAYEFVDLFDVKDAELTKLHGQGKKVICYFSAGSSENWRSDFKKLPASALGKPLDGWEGERWLDIRNAGVLSVMKARIAKAKSRGCDGVDMDNVDGHLNKSGFPLNARDQTNYLEALTREAHAKHLLAGLKNSPETAWSLEPNFDFVVIEECHKYKECTSYKAFATARKPMFEIEYTKRNSKTCADAAKQGAAVVFANLDLTQFTFCP